MSTYSGLLTRLLLPLTLLTLAAGCGDLWPLDSDITCGNNAVDADKGEVCDGAALGGKDCKTEGFSGGTLSCDATCSALVTAGCYKCGDGKLDAQNGEACDGADLGGRTCAKLGFEGGDLKCKDGCGELDVSGCYKCGDGKLDTANSEVCDGKDLGTKTCASALGVTEASGTLKCMADCSGVDSTGCYTCGDGVKHLLEPCDGANLGGLSCVGGGYDGGFLDCKSDCSGHDPTGCYAWSVGLRLLSTKSGSHVENGKAIAIDIPGNRYTAGSFQGEVSYYVKTGSNEEEQKVKATGSPDALLVKQDNTGKVVWIKGTSGNSSTNANAVATDMAGNVYVAGIFSGTVTFFDGATQKTAASGADLFVAKLDSSGKLLWTTTAGGSMYAEVKAIALNDKKSGVHVTGAFMGKTNIGSPPLSAVNGQYGSPTQDIFVARLDEATGSITWATGLGGTGMESGQGITVDSAGNSYITGRYNGKITYDKSSTPAMALEPALKSDGKTYSQDLFVVKLDSAGKVLWAQGAGSNQDKEEGAAIALDLNEDLVIAGTFAGKATFGKLSATINNHGSVSLSKTDGFVAWMGKGGAFTRVMAVGGGGDDDARGVAVDSAGNIHLTGSIGASTTLGAYYLPCQGEGNMFVAELDKAGAVLRAAAPIIPSGSAAGSGKISGIASAVDADGKGYHVADFSTAVTVGDTLLTANGLHNLLVLSLYSSPYLFESMRSGTTEDLRSVWGSGKGDVYAVGGKAALHFNGIKWKEVNLDTRPAGLHLASVWGSGPKDVVMVGNYTTSSSVSAGVSFQYDGTTWTHTELTANETEILTAVGGSGAGEVYAFGVRTRAGVTPPELTVYKRSGAAWSLDSYTQAAVTYVPKYNSVWAAGPGDLWAVGGACFKGCGSALQRLQGGKWAGAGTVNAGHLTGIWGTSASNVYISGYNITYQYGVKSGKIARYDGSTWNTVHGFTGKQALGIWGLSSGEIWVTQEDGQLLHHDGQKKWTSVATPAVQALTGLWGSKEAGLFVVGDGGTILRKW